ncbi:MAG: DUF2975 domain-containing protein [Eubacteriales bacterium]|nr:DUF2975 domain-containing protein [Eubacteriales bacterium]
MGTLWNEKRSIVLTRVCTALLMAGCAVMMALGVPVSRFFIDKGMIAVEGAAALPLCLGMGYLCGAAALAMLYLMWRFLGRLQRDEVFTRENVTALRRISWCCAAGALFSLLTGVILIHEFLYVALAAGFMTLIIRIVKNAFEKAVLMKDELDYTV